ncbi:Putative peroxiredoxin bcp [Maioricimonas rarisocia]|uniref:thioredoxin-dependent peroxiredoxin n=1 Tax=Maioricimonas rarisocia TaxID=2528026 RepID=A0A517Z4N8_9PLAN|nr:peroxiredoxin [Maioricimonas rarisocia]QDU37448.1 Putative peroxiredoxin bcp [Maioricimonas rarisocia]
MQTALRTLVLTGCIGLLVSGAQAAEKGKSLSVGDPAPQFSLLDDEGKEWKSSEHYGEKIVVVYFYPADMTGGCTKQACGFRDDMSKLKSEDVEVVGISGDSVRNHQLFKQAHDLNFTLLADTEGKAAEKFGVPYTPGERTVKAVIGGKEFDLVRTVTTRRWTFVVDKEGKIAMINSKVKAAEDSKAVMEAISKLD